MNRPLTLLSNAVSSKAVQLNGAPTNAAPAEHGAHAAPQSAFAKLLAGAEQVNACTAAIAAKPNAAASAAGSPALASVPETSTPAPTTLLDRATATAQPNAQPSGASIKRAQRKESAQAERDAPLTKPSQSVVTDTPAIALAAPPPMHAEQDPTWPPFAIAFSPFSPADLEGAAAQPAGGAAVPTTTGPLAASVERNGSAMGINPQVAPSIVMPPEVDTATATVESSAEIESVDAAGPDVVRTSVPGDRSNGARAHRPSAAHSAGVELQKTRASNSAAEERPEPVVSLEQPLDAATGKASTTSNAGARKSDDEPSTDASVDDTTAIRSPTATRGDTRNAAPSLADLRSSANANASPDALRTADAPARDASKSVAEVRPDPAATPALARDAAVQGSEGGTLAVGIAKTSDHAVAINTQGASSGNERGGDEALARRQQAVTAAVNQMALRKGAHAEVDVPELGRIRIEAVNRQSEVDVTVIAERRGSANVLRDAMPMLATHLKEASIPLGSLEIGARDPSRQHAAGSSNRDASMQSNADSGSSRSDARPRRERNPDGVASDESDGISTPRARVRIVL